MIVGLVGKIGSGKSTAAQVFLDLGFTRIAFADYMKETLAEALDVPPEWFYTEEGKNRSVELPDLVVQLDTWLLRLQDECPWCDFAPAFKALDSRFLDACDRTLNIQTYRELLQWAGTELLRACDQDFHVKVTFNLINKYPTWNFVMDDIRFPNELDAVKNQGGFVIKLLRNWDVKSSHASENALNDVPNDVYDIVVDNRGATKEVFVQTIEQIATHDIPVKHYYVLEADKPSSSIDLLVTAMARQSERYGETNAELECDDPYLLAIVTEQVGKAADMLSYLRLLTTDETYIDDRQHLKTAVLGIAASAMMWLEKFDA